MPHEDTELALAGGPTPAADYQQNGGKDRGSGARAWGHQNRRRAKFRAKHQRVVAWPVPVKLARGGVGPDPTEVGGQRWHTRRSQSRPF